MYGWQAGGHGRFPLKLHFVHIRTYLVIGDLNLHKPLLTKCFGDISSLLSMLMLSAFCPNLKLCRSTLPSSMHMSFDSLA